MASSPARPCPAAPPPRRAPRPDPPVVCPGFGLDRFMQGMSGKSAARGSYVHCRAEKRDGAGLSGARQGRQNWTPTKEIAQGTSLLD